MTGEARRGFSASARSGVHSAAAALRGSRLGLAVLALLVGAGSGLGAVGFRWLIFGVTWTATGYREFGQQGRIPSLHFPSLGIVFLLLIPIVGGLLYGPLIERFAKEARGHGVPEVMLAIAENGGRIRPPVTGVKAIASALCIGTGGSVGREGPIVQIGSAYASTLGQLTRVSETRLRFLVGCGAAGGIAATFNAPITGVFFGFEIVLREFSIDALFAIILSSVTADLVSRAFFGSAPFFATLPHDLYVRHWTTYLLMVLLGVAAGLLGWGFTKILYKFEDLVEAAWRTRPEWARPAAGGLALGALLLAVPEMYGVGYPVMAKAIDGQYVLWFLLVLLVAKLIATSLTLSIGGSGGIFAPSLFVGAMVGMAFGSVVSHFFGPIVSSPAVFAVVAMGGVFGASAQAPLTAIASALEMTGNFTMTVPVMLVVGIATALSKRLSYGNIYTTKLLRRGVDIDRAKVTNVLQTLTVGSVMMPLGGDGAAELTAAPLPKSAARDALTHNLGTVVEFDSPQVLFPDETLENALRQLLLYGRLGLPVVSPDQSHLLGWLTRRDVLRSLGERIDSASREAEAGHLASEFSEAEDTTEALHAPRPLGGYVLMEAFVSSDSPADGRRLDAVPWPEGSVVVAVSRHLELMPPRPQFELRNGERVIVLVPSAEGTEGGTSRDGPHGPDARTGGGPGPAVGPPGGAGAPGEGEPEEGAPEEGAVAEGGPAPELGRSGDERQNLPQPGPHPSDVPQPGPDPAQGDAS